MFSYPCVALVFVAACTAQVQITNVKPDLRTAICKQRNTYYKVDGSCDSYIECIDFIAKEMSCPDGLHYNPEAEWPIYPCGYPMDVPCVGRGSAQPAQPTADCPHQYGFFPSPVATSDNCGQFRTCVAGRAIETVCPVGLAFNPDISRCDWPENVATCNAEQYLGFSCPAAPTDVDGTLLDITANYEYQGNCYYFFSCRKGHARLLSCDKGLAFDPVSGRCVNDEYVNCDTTPLAGVKPQ